MLIAHIIFAWSISNVCMHYHHPILMQWPLVCEDRIGSSWLVHMGKNVLTVVSVSAMSTITHIAVYAVISS